MNHKNTSPLSELKAGLIKVLMENSYRPETLTYFKKKLMALEQYIILENKYGILSHTVL